MVPFWQSFNILECSLKILKYPKRWPFSSDLDRKLLIKESQKYRKFLTYRVATPVYSRTCHSPINTYLPIVPFMPSSKERIIFFWHKPPQKHLKFFCGLTPFFTETDLGEHYSGGGVLLLSLLRNFWWIIMKWPSIKLYIYYIHKFRTRYIRYHKKNSLKFKRW